MTLHVRRNGAGLLEMSTVNGPLGSSPPVRQALQVKSADVRAFERAIKYGGFSQVAADRRSLRRRETCYDGEHVVFEAHVADRYRYVNRHTCDDAFERVKVWGGLLQRLTRPSP